jgi:hypothetical protein
MGTEYILQGQYISRHGTKGEGSPQRKRLWAPAG